MTIYSLVVLLSRFELVICSKSSSHHCFLTHTHVFQQTVRWSRTPISLRIFQFAVIHIAKSFSIVNEAEVDVFLKLPCFLHDPTNAGNMASDSSASSNNYLQGTLLSFIVYPNSEKSAELKIIQGYPICMTELQLPISRTL